MICEWPYLKRLFLVLVFVAVSSGSVCSVVFAQNADMKSADMTGADSDLGFVYSPVGKRDPFTPLIQQVNKEIKKPRKISGPLEKFELSQFRLLAMLIVQGTPRAMVKAPDGKSYTIKPGDLIGPNGGVVKRIETKTFAIDEETGQKIEKSPDRVIVQEPVLDNFTGKMLQKDSYIEM